MSASPVPLKQKHTLFTVYLDVHMFVSLLELREDFKVDYNFRLLQLKQRQLKMKNQSTRLALFHAISLLVFFRSLGEYNPAIRRPPTYTAAN